MSNRVATIEDIAEATSEPWGEASEYRGKSHLQLALDFVEQFPINSRIDAETFDNWAQSQGLFTVPPVGTPKQSDAWKAHLMRRHEARYRINRSGMHPRLLDHGSTPFSMETVRQGLYEVRPPHSAVAQSGMPQKVANYIHTKRRRLQYLMQSADWNVLPPYERVVAETIYDDIDAFTDSVDAQASRISNKLNKLESRIKKAVEAGQIKPTNGGIAGLLAADQETPC